MAKIKNTAFEVKVTSSKRNDAQNITGLFGYMVSDDFVEDDCSAGFLCVKHGRIDNSGYETPVIRDGSGFTGTSGLKNANSWQMIAAGNGLSGGMKGDRTGIYACNTYDVNKAVSGDLSVNIPGETLGLTVPAGDKTDFTELMVGEMYNFASGNFSILPMSLLPYAEIVNGRLSAMGGKPEDGSVYFQHVPMNEHFTKGAQDAGEKYTMLCLRAEDNTNIIIVRAGTYNATTGEWRNNAPYSITYNETSGKYVVTGIIPYGPADQVFPNAPGYRFATKITNKKVDSSSVLPSGIICKVTNTSAPGGYNEYTKAAFEDDGSLINIFAPTAGTLSAKREIKIKWNDEDGFETYTFDLSGATLQGVYSIAASVTNGSYSGATQILQGETANGTISSAAGYLLPNEITVTGATANYDSETGAISISSPTGNATITAVCTLDEKFYVGDNVTKIKFDTTLPVENVTTILSELSYTGAEVEDNQETINLIVANGTLTDNGVLKATRITIAENTYVYAITVFTANAEGVDPIIVWASAADAEHGIIEGFQNLQSDGTMAVSWVVNEILQGSVWNNKTLVGKTAI